MHTPLVYLVAILCDLNVEQLTVYHAHQLTLKTFCFQHFNYGCGAFRFHQAKTQRTNEHIKVEPLKFYLNLLRYPFLQKSSQPKILVTILLLISQFANVAGFFWEQWQFRELTISSKTPVISAEPLTQTVSLSQSIANLWQVFQSPISSIFQR